MLITTRFELAAPVEAAWAYLLDVPKIAHCVPGASLIEVIDDKTYAGKVGGKLGPIGVSYKGQITIESMDAATHTAAIKAAGNETRGRGCASAPESEHFVPSEKDASFAIDSELSSSGGV